MSVRLVTFLGRGRYEETTYYLGSDELRTCFVAHAVASFRKASEVVVIATQEAQESYNNRSRLTTCIRRDCGVEPRFETIGVGKTEAELWEQFEVLKRALRPPPGTSVVLDITHGFRAQPFFAAAVASFVRSVDRDPAPLCVFYGAWDARDEEQDRTPVWDLTAFVDLVDWSKALTLFLRTGRVEGVAQPAERLGKELRKHWFLGGRQGPEPTLRELARALERFGSDVETVRTGSLLLGRPSHPSSAGDLFRELCRGEESLTRALPPLADVLDRVKEMVAPLKLPEGTSHLGGAEGLRALAALVRLYLRMGRYAEAAATLREAWVTRYATADADCPGLQPFDGEARKRAERRWRHLCGHTADRISEVRNDIEHGGYNVDPKPPRTLRQQLEELAEEFAQTATVPLPGSIFLNLSNHPRSEWPPEQVAAALSLCREIVDLPFPAVDPRHGPEEIGELAAEVLARVPDATTHAMVQGEFTLTGLLVRKLSERGIRCLAATTERLASSDGEGFRFVRFRPYVAAGF